MKQMLDTPVYFRGYLIFCYPKTWFTFLQMHHYQVDLELSLICKYKDTNFFFKSSSFICKKVIFCQVCRGEIVHSHKSQSSDICRKSFSNAILNVKNITLAPHSHFPSHSSLHIYPEPFWHASSQMEDQTLHNVVEKTWVKVDPVWRK